ncbi:MAG: hypothetical protein EBY22_07025, partial [Gammaproteobacteria bacterium]|nr:hypothetical protein [Gammaproteobacteria bacterium]
TFAQTPSHVPTPYMSLDQVLTGAHQARELGCTNTQFANPHGLHNLNHYTTPRDLAIIARAAMQQPLFRQIVATKQARWEAPSGLQLLTNHNNRTRPCSICNIVMPIKMLTAKCYKQISCLHFSTINTDT